MNRRFLPLVIFTLTICGILTLIAFQPPTRAQASPHDLAADMVACWDLDEASGTRYDSVGSNELTDNNTVGSGAGLIGNAAVFVRANSESLSVADNASLSMGNISATLAAWVNMDSTASNNVILSKDSIAGNREYNLAYRTDNGNYFTGFFANGASTVQSINASNAGTPSSGTWYLVVLWVDNTENTINIQVNNGTRNSSAKSITVGDSASAFKIGRDDVQGISYEGKIDSVMIWKRVLTSDERTELYNSGTGLSCENILVVPTPTPTQTPTVTPTETPIPTTATPTPDGNNYYDLTLPSGNVATVERVITFGDIATATALFVLTAVILVGLVYMGGVKQWFR